MGRARCWKEMFGSRSVQHCIQLVCQVVKHAADVVQDGDRRFFTGERAGSQTAEKRARLLTKRRQRCDSRQGRRDGESVNCFFKDLSDC